MSDSISISFSNDDKPTPKAPTQYNSVVAWVFVINYVLGVGILGMPYAFHQAGVLLSSGLVIFITFLTVIATMWLVEVGARAQGLFDAGVLGLPDDRSRLVNSIQDSDDIKAKAFDDNARQTSVVSTGSYVNIYSDSPPNFTITQQKFEVNQLCKIFLGQFGKLFYEICIILYMLGTLWSYTAVFASSMTAFVPIPGLSLHHNCNIYEKTVDWTWGCEGSYLIFVGLYLIIVLPLACVDLADQQIVQIVLCALRWIGLFVMYTTVLVSMFHQPYEDLPNVSGPPYLADKTLAKTAGFGVIFTTAVFSQLIQHSAPGLVQPVKNKKMLFWVFGGGLSATCLLYIILGCLCASYFGDNTHQVASLNWVSYMGTYFEHGGSASIFPKMISTFVVLFPVITVVSAFPLMAITLGNNIFFGLPVEWTDNHRDNKMKLIIRLLSCLPPLIGACILKKLAIIIEFTGMSGFFVGFIIPGVLQWQAKRVCVAKWGEAGKKTPFSSFFSHDIWAGLGVAFGFGALIFTIVELIIGLF